MKKAKFYNLICLIIAIAVAVFTVGYSFAWLLNREDSGFSIAGSSNGAYFGGGNGTKGSPYEIYNSTHMFNLAWLQGTGILEKNQKYYFRVVKDFDMGDIWLPPIGNDDNPFVSEFDGEGHTISNLKITTDKSKLSACPTGYQFSNSVGLFGVTANIDGVKGDDKNTEKLSNIHNFILKNPVVEVASTSQTSYTSGAKSVAGIAVGHVAGKCSSIGILAKENTASRWNDAASLLMNRTDSEYSTFNSILGELGEGVTSSVTGGGHVSGTGGSGAAFGANFDMASVLDRLYKIFRGKYGYEYVKDSNNDPVPLPNSSPELPQISTANNLPTPAAGAKIAFTVTNADSLDYSASDAAEAISNQNVGYFLGNENKFDTKTFTFSERLHPPFSANWEGKIFVKGSWEKTTDLYLESSTGKPYILDGEGKVYITPQTDEDGDYVYNGQKLGIDAGTNWFTLDSSGNKKTPAESGNIPSWFYTYDSYVSDNAGTVYRSDSGFRELRQSEYDELPNSLKSLLAEAGAQKSFTTIRISQGGLIAQNHGNTEKTQWSYHGQISWMGKTYGKGFKGADGTAVDENGNLMPVTAVYDEDGNYVSGDYYTGDGIQSKLFNYYTGGIALPNNAIWFKPAQAGKFRFVMYSQSNGDGFILNKIVRNSASPEEPFKVDPTKVSNNITMSTVIQQKLPSEVLLYYEYNVTDAEIAAGNVEFLLQKNGSGGAHFIYLDIGASAEEEDISGIDREKSVSAVDFIYDTVKIKQGDPATDDTAEIKVGDFIVGSEKYDSTKTSVYFDKLNTVLKIVYVRLHNDSGSNHSDKTICLEKSDPELNTESPVMATFARYVCPTISGGSSSVSGGGSSGGGEVVDPDPGPETPTVSAVTVTPATATVEAGNTTELNASITMSDGSTYDGNIVWTSSDESIATVAANGKITAKAAGEVTITATAGGKFATCKVTVTAAQSGGPTEITYSNLASATLDKDNFLLDSNANGFTAKSAYTWSGEINGTTKEYTGAYRVGGTGRASAVKLKAGQKLTLVVGANGDKTSQSGKVWLGTTGSTAQSDAIEGTLTDVTSDESKVCHGLLTFTATADTTYYILYSKDTTIFAVIIE